jgi:hypothetical protein
MILHWIFIVPIILFTFFRNIYNFGPKHCKRSLFEILCNPVPGIEFAGQLAKSDNFDSLKRCCFNHNPIAQRITRNKYLAAKRATQSSTIIVYNCPLSKIIAWALKLHGYETYATFHDTSRHHDVTASAHSIPMTLHIAILEFSCPEIVFLSLLQCPSDGLITSFVVLIMVSMIFTIMTTCTCFKISYQGMKQIQNITLILREIP